jgi:hypothetical protein
MRREPVTSGCAGLIPFAEPDHCLVTLAGSGGRTLDE